MPRSNAPKPPPVMTWVKATPVLLTAGIFDATRVFFELFWFFGPVLGAVVCTASVNNFLGASVGGAVGNVVATVCTVVAGTAGAYGVALTTSFGVIMSMVFGMFGFLTLGLWILMTNARIFKAEASGVVWFMGSFVLSEIPFIGAIPSFTITLFKLYRTQIRVEKAAFKQFQKEQAAKELQEHREQEAQLIQQAEAKQQEEIFEQQEREEGEAQAARDARTDEALQRAELADQTRGETSNDNEFFPKQEKQAS